jgi:beta-glucosidase
MAMSNGKAFAPNEDTATLNRSSFPAGFIFGTATSAYQIEGAANEGGRKPCIWDTFSQCPGKIKDGSSGNVACDSYHRYKEDVGIMKDIGFEAYRFSISWSRVLPDGKLSGGVNQEGISYYNNLIDELIANGLEPFVTLFHWDLPQTLEDEYGGFLSPKVAEDFRDYADLCYKEFGDRVKHWITLNEPWTFTNNGYATGHFAPGRCSQWQQKNSDGGDSGTEPYLVSHHSLLAHAAAVQVYRQKYQASQKGKIGITHLSHWMVPSDDHKDHHEAAERALDFMFGWYMDPLTNGDYPESMKSLVGDRLPKFSKEQSKMLMGSFDFLGLNYYTSYYAAHAPHFKNANPSYLTDSLADLMTERNGIPIGPKAASDWLFIYPNGIRELLLYTKRKYNNPIIYITENGMDETNDETLSLEEALADNRRVDYYHQHLSSIQSAIEEGVDVRGYFAWSLLDNFEWDLGYSVRFGINYVDYKDGLKRYPKLSAKWFKNLLKN